MGVPTELKIHDWPSLIRHLQVCHCNAQKLNNIFLSLQLTNATCIFLHNTQTPHDTKWEGKKKKRERRTWGRFCMCLNLSQIPKGEIHTYKISINYFSENCLSVIMKSIQIPWHCTSFRFVLIDVLQIPNLWIILVF